MKPEFDWTKQQMNEFCSSVHETITKKWLCKKDHELTCDMQTLMYCSTLTFHIRGTIRFILTMSSTLATDICIASARTLVCLRVKLWKAKLIVSSSMTTIRKPSATRIYTRSKALLSERWRHNARAIVIARAWWNRRKISYENLRIDDKANNSSEATNITSCIMK